MWLYVLLLLVFFLGAGFLLAAPLPLDIYDRRKLQVTEFLLRLTAEYLADLVEKVFGPNVRNAFFRFVAGIGFLIPLPPPSCVKVYDEKMRGVRVRCYEPKNLRSKRPLVFIHGGGWCTMKPDYYDSLLYWFVKHLGVKIFSIDYRLAPEHPFPIPVEDCLAVVEHLHERGVDYGVDGSKIAIMGDSAGGNLSAVITQNLKDKKFISCQVLIYPVTSMFSFNLPSYQEYYKKFKGTAILNPRAMARWTLMYMGLPAHNGNIKKLLKNRHISKELRSSPEYEKYIQADLIRKMYTEEEFGNYEENVDVVLAEQFKKALNPSVSPIFGVTSNLPPTLVLTCGYDVLRDEGIIYYKALKEAGVEAVHLHYERGFHGIFNMPWSDIKKEMNISVSKFLEPYLLE